MSLASKNAKSSTNIIVQKYGGATLADPEKIKLAAKRIFNLHSTGTPLVVVVSAMGQTTNQLIQLAQQISTRPHLRELDMLLSVGERISMSLLSMALNDLGCSAISFTGSQAGIMTDDSHVNANITEVKAYRVEEAIAANKVVILAGFQGVSAKTKEITTLGRGGSDITAVAMAAYLKAARCEILKDVDCVYTADPKLTPHAKPIKELNYSQLLDMTAWGAKVLHHRSVELAANEGVNLYVGPADDDSSIGTLVTRDKEFSIQAPIAINSFNQIFEIEFLDINYTFESFQRHLHENQIGQPELLITLNTQYFVTAPQEILLTILGFEKNSKIFKIRQSNLCSVSVTFSKPCQQPELTTCRRILEFNKIDVIHSFIQRNSANFVLAAANRINVITKLHDHYFS